MGVMVQIFIDWFENKRKDSFTVTLNDHFY